MIATCLQGVWGTWCLLSKSKIQKEPIETNLPESLIKGTIETNLKMQVEFQAYYIKFIILNKWLYIS